MEYDYWRTPFLANGETAEIRVERTRKRRAELMLTRSSARNGMSLFEGHGRHAGGYVMQAGLQKAMIRRSTVTAGAATSSHPVPLPNSIIPLRDTDSRRRPAGMRREDTDTESLHLPSQSESLQRRRYRIAYAVPDESFSFFGAQQTTAGEGSG